MATPEAWARQAEDAAEPSASATPVKAQNFSGFVTDKTDSSITVSRKGTGKEMLQRVFVIDALTKVEGNLKLNARVTVRYDSNNGTDHAIRILVR